MKKFNARGFAFTLDAVIGGLLAIAILAAIATSFRTGAPEIPEALQLNALARDSLAVMDKQGILKNTFSQNDTIAAINIRNFLNDALPLEYAANVSVEAYEYKASGSCPNDCRLDGVSPVNSFCACRRFNANTTPAMNSSVIGAARRMFYVQAGQSNSTDERFGRAEIRVWQRR